VIVTVRTWQLNRLDYAEFVRISEEEYWPLFDKHGCRALGIWGVRVGAAERLMVMTRYDSLDHWLGTRAWGEAGDKLKAISDRRDRMILDTDLIALNTLSRRQPKGDAPEIEPGVYVWEAFRVARQNVERFRELTEDQWLPQIEGSGSIRLVGMWNVFIGPQNLVYMLTRADSIGTWEHCHALGGDQSPALEQRTAISEKTSVQLLHSVTKRRP
jgi:NIPSNAP